MPRRKGRLQSREKGPEPFALAGKRGRPQLGNECGDTSIHQSRGSHGDASGLMHQWAMVAPRSFGALVVDLVHRFLASVEQETGRNGTLSFSKPAGSWRERNRERSTTPTSIRSSRHTGRHAHANRVLEIFGAVSKGSPWTRRRSAHALLQILNTFGGLEN